MANEPPTSQQAQGNYIAQAADGSIAVVNVVVPLPPEIQEQNRVRFLKQLRDWYDEAWEQIFQRAECIPLELVSKPEHIELSFLSGHRPELPLSSWTSIIHAYEQAGNKLVLLGEPGAGKSTLLLDLAKYLVVCAQQDSQQPLPVILPLATWVVKRPPLVDWLGDQIAKVYKVSNEISNFWVQTNQILPLLDGLDEVPQVARAACHEEIIRYRDTHLVPLVVCSRQAEYEEIPCEQRLTWHRTVVVQPLTQQQIEAYLLVGGKSLAAVRTVLDTNAVLQKLTTTPLMLHVLSLAYANASVQELPQRGTAEEQQQAVFARYIEVMVESKGNLECYPLQQTKTWLRWLARQMQEHNQTIFFLGQLQPDWLAYKQKAAYSWSIGLIFGLVGGLAFGLVGGLIFGQTIGLGSWLLNGLSIGALFGLLNGLIYGRLNEPNAAIQLEKTLLWSWKKARFGLLIGLLLGLTDLSRQPHFSLSKWKETRAHTLAFTLLQVGLEMCSDLL